MKPMTEAEFMTRAKVGADRQSTADRFNALRDLMLSLGYHDAARVVDQLQADYEELQSEADDDC